MIDTNVRNIKRTENGFSGLKKPQLGVENLCLNCARNPTCYSYNELSSSKIFISKIIECKDYIWPLVFRDTRGTENEFNTFRMGEAWFNRLKKGDKVGLVDKDNVVYGVAMVTKSFALPKQTALDNHGSKNHLMLNEDNAAEKLAKVLRNSYGGLVYGNNDFISVIYFTRVA